MLKSRVAHRSPLIGAALVLMLLLVAAVPSTTLRAARTPASSRPAPMESSSQTAETGKQLLQLLDHFSSRYWARVAGRDTNLPPHVNGHDEFLADWTKQMLSSLHGLPVGVVRQPFKTPGFRHLPAQRPGVNVLVVVPGSRHADQAFVIGAHPDGEPWSEGSAFDDASGSVLMLELARSLGQIWRADGLPSLTVEFVLFDAEEEGLIGSSDYSFAYRHGAIMPRPVFMIDEEQSGVGYPARPFGSLSADPMPSFATTTGRISKGLARLFGPLIHPRKAALTVAIRRLTGARTSVFAELHKLYPSLPYRGGAASAFTSSDEHYLEIGPFPLCCSDNAPFEALGLPTVTFSGNTDYYARNAAAWSFPYDQPEDTLAAMACDTGGSPQPSTALAAALQLPLGLSEALVQDYTPPALGSDIAIFSSLPTEGAAVQFQAVGAKQFTWEFGDGTRGTGATVSHIYARAGSYPLRVRAGRNTGLVHVRVSGRKLEFASSIIVNPPPRRPWHPTALQDIPGCH